MRALATSASNDAVRPLRVQYRREMNCQIVYDSIHTRPGWSSTYALQLDGAVAGFGSVAIGGPWTANPAIFEFYVLPAHRGHAFRLFEALLQASGTRLMEIQSNDTLLAVMLHTYAREVWSESIVFRDGVTTAPAPPHGAILQGMTSEADTRAAIAERAGGTEWRLHLDGEPVGRGGILFHYNEPYGDIYMEIDEPFRRRGLGAYLVQELKRVAYELGSVPCARCNSGNAPSRRTLQKAGFVPCAHILHGAIAAP